jgi:ubiquinone/menaquinone biosynthesis C-methylase UbiE
MSQAAVQQYWEREPCGTSSWITGGEAPKTKEWFKAVERHRYEAEPHIFSVAQFTRWKGARLLEIGVGAGADHVQWARAGVECHGVDLTSAAVETTRAHLALHGLRSELRRADAENLPYADETFDVVYSWGVIHHSEHPERIVAEIHRVLRSGGTFIGMLYARRSLVAAKLWVRRALLAGKPFRSLADVVANHMESQGTKAYTPDEVHEMFRAFSSVSVRSIATIYDQKWLGPLARLVPDVLGWNLAVTAWR